MGKSTSSSSKKRSRAPEEDVVDSGDSTAAVKKSKIDASGKAEVTKNGAVSESPAKKEKKDKKDKKEKKEKKSKDVKVVDAPAEVVEEKKAKKEKKSKDDRKDKKDKKSKKDKSKDAADEDVEMTNGHSTPVAPETNGDAPAAAETPSKKSKKDKKDKKDKKSKKSKSDTNGTTTENGADSPEADDKEEPETAAAEGAKGTRFICFIGNLPYSATVESITAHFATVHPTSVRMLTERENPAKSKGIAFVEFGRFDHMKTCLEKFHHTEFDDGVSPARKINVELTYISSPPSPYLDLD